MKKILPLFLFIISLYFQGYSQVSFIAVDSSNFHICWTGQTLKFFDFDNDNDLDILRVNSDTRLIYENTGNNNFNINFNFPAFPVTQLYSNFEPFRDFIDYDNDGDIDILFGNYSSRLITQNTLPDSISFVEQTLYNTNIISSVDNIYNYQGKDVINKLNYSYFTFSSLTNSLINEIKDTLNDGNNYFKIINTEYDDNSRNYDINKDGFLDLITPDYLFINNGFDSINKFHIKNRVSNNSYINPTYVDLDNDGYLDEISRNGIKRNDSNSNFVSQSSTILNNFNAEIYSTGDFNNDGNIDIVSYGYNGSIDIYYNSGNFQFNRDSNVIIPNSYISNLIATDIDDDGDIDIAVITMLHNSSGGVSVGFRIYQNNSQSSNNPPTKPTKCWSTIDENKIIFHWNPATDIETPSQSLSYNVMVGTTPNGIEIVSPLSDTITGFRRVVEMGNAQLNNFFILDKSKFNIGDTLYWRVQTIDNGMQYSEFSSLNTLVICDYMKAPVYDTICSNDSVLWRGNYYSTNGIHKDNYGINTCDSTFSLNLKVNPAYLYLEDIDICSNESYTWRGQTYYSSGTHINQFTTTQGCDSLYKLDLDVHHSVTNILDEQICVQDSFPFAGGFLNSSGFYTDSSQTTFGCDSLTLLTLTVSPSDTAVFKSNDTLFTTNYSAYKRWYNCETQNYVPNQNNSYFIPNQPGKYAAELTENGCTWLSKCFDFTYLGIEDLENIEISVEPNPASDLIIIKSDALNKNSEIKIYSSDSKLVFNQKSNTNNKLNLNIESLSSGVYFIKIITTNRVYSTKFVKK